MAIGDFSFPPDKNSFPSWSFAHAAHHIDIQNAVFNLNGVRLDNWILDPFNVDDPGVWAYYHQVMHNQFNQQLGIQGEDLTDIDFSDPDVITDWVYANLNEHQQAAAILGIG
jgi:hypothetical protein